MFCNPSLVFFIEVRSICGNVACVLWKLFTSLCLLNALGPQFSKFWSVLGGKNKDLSVKLF